MSMSTQALEVKVDRAGERCGQHRNRVAMGNEELLLLLNAREEDRPTDEMTNRQTLGSK